MDLDARLTRIEDKLDRNTEVTIENTSVLAEHQRRSVALEQYVQKLEADVKPLKMHVAMWAGVSKALVTMGALVGLLGGLRAFGIF
jgi:hypothetical protein